MLGLPGPLKTLLPLLSVPSSVSPVPSNTFHIVRSLPLLLLLLFHSFADKVLRIESLLPEINHVNFKEAMGVIQQVVDEHGDEGLGLTEVYRAGMQACVNFGAFEEVLRLLDEVTTLARESYSAIAGTIGTGFSHQ